MAVKYIYAIGMFLFFVFIIFEIIVMLRNIKNSETNSENVQKNITKNKTYDVKKYIIKSFSSILEFSIFLVKEIFKYLFFKIKKRKRKK